jgi:hypothetical protein
VTDHLLRQALLTALCPAPSVLVFFLIYRKRQTTRARSRAPLQQTRRRPPGESLRVRLEEIDEQIYEWMAYLAVSPAIVGLAAGFFRAQGVALPATLFSASVVWSGVCAWKLRELYGERVDLELGFDGRRRVAEELNRLTAEGFEVYHDVPFEGFNIDHVLLGPPGVFAVETKTRPRPGDSLAPGQDRVEFDGFRVNWPMSSESYGLERAVANAQLLGQWLSGALGEPIDATPILTLPGWAIDSTSSNQNVLVLNAREIGKLCDSKTVLLEEDLIRRICQQMNQKCGSG